MHTQRGKTEGDKKRGGNGRDGGPGERWRIGKGEWGEKRERKEGEKKKGFWISAITKLTDPVRCISPISSLFISPVFVYRKHWKAVLGDQVLLPTVSLTASLSAELRRCLLSAQQY